MNKRIIIRAAKATVLVGGFFCACLLVFILVGILMGA